MKPKVFSVRIHATITKCVEVEAANEREACNKAQSAFNIRDYHDFDEVEVFDCEEITAYRDAA